MSTQVKAYDSAYPGSMVDRDDGYYLCRNDHKSLAAGLVELIASRDRELEDLRDTSDRLHAANVELLDALDAISKNDPYHFSSAGIIARKALEKHGATS